MKKQSNHDQIQADHWDKIARSRYQDVKTTVPAQKEMVEFFHFLDLKNNSKILEIGCGTGRYTLPLLKNNHQITATDLSSSSLEVLKNHAIKNKVNNNLTLEKNNFEDEKKTEKYIKQFDLAMMIAVIHHFHPKKRKIIFKNIVNSIKSNGQVVALEPNPLNPFYYLLYFWRWLNNSSNVNRWQTEKGMLFTNAQNLKKLFQESGLNNITIRRYAFLPSKSGNYFPLLLSLNDFIVKIPLLKEFSAFIWIKGVKK
jgi:2-polyprenyl-3-methyl-5-hydroxy-6-metoxy-1,4-benzoquinol methylase